MNYEKPIKVNGSEKHNRALGREWLVKYTSDPGWGPYEYVLKTHPEAIEDAIAWLGVPGTKRSLRIYNIYTGDVESVSGNPIRVKQRPNAGRMTVEHEIGNKRYYLVKTQTTCVRCRPDKGDRYPKCRASHPEMVLEVWRFVVGHPAQCWTAPLAVNGIAFVNLANALKAAEQAKASIFDSETGRRIRYESVVTGLIMFERKVAKLVSAARKAEAKGVEFWDNLS